jgi:two-component system cell cycle sensor histidine kinase/response regulator CckA
MSGPELRDMIKASRPDIKVLFMSGYTSNVIVHHGVLEEGVHFIQKPFSMHDLARKVHHALGDG